MPLRGSSRHGWNSWKGYLAAHQSRLDQYDHFLVADDLHYRIGEREVISEGTLRFLDGYELEVARRQEVTVRNGEPRVRTVRYSYHALHRGRAAVRSLFRYDNVHPHPGHETPHHRHEYDWNGNQINPPKHVGEDGWPTLGDVIDELHEYWRQTR